MYFRVSIGADVYARENPNVWTSDVLEIDFVDKLSWDTYYAKK